MRGPGTPEVNQELVGSRVLLPARLSLSVTVVAKRPGLVVGREPG